MGLVEIHRTYSFFYLKSIIVVVMYKFSAILTAVSVQMQVKQNTTQN